MNKLILLSLLLVISSSTWAGRYSFPFLGRNFTLVTPSSETKEARPLLVVLHGCKQGPDLFLAGSQLEVEAQKHNFYMLLPEQSQYYNIDHCWNWFFDLQQMRVPNNEMYQIVGAVEYAFSRYSINKNKVFVTGMSAGGAMAHNLATCYPDIFKGAAIHSGLNYKTAENMYEAQTVLTSYQQKSPEYLGERMFHCATLSRKNKLDRVMIIHGLGDSRVPPLHADLISESQAVWRDYLDDGMRNGSIKGKVHSTKTRSAHGYEIQEKKTIYPNFVERRLLIKNLGHAWGGGKPVSVNFDPAAPSSNDLILSFFELK